MTNEEIKQLTDNLKYQPAAQLDKGTGYTEQELEEQALQQRAQPLFEQLKADPSLANLKKTAQEQFALRSPEVYKNVKNQLCMGVSFGNVNVFIKTGNDLDPFHIYCVEKLKQEGFTVTETKDGFVVDLS